MKKIGFIGQGWVGKHCANNLERRGFEVVRYAKEEPHSENNHKVSTCDIVFIAVPTPTTPDGFDDSVVREVIKLVGKGNIAVIKSTVIPGTTLSIQKENLDIIVLHSPEFLREASARSDADNPDRNIVGMPFDIDSHHEAARAVMKILPKAKSEHICSSHEAELVKYGANGLLVTKVVYMNILYDLANKLGCNWETVRDAMLSDPRLGHSHMDPVHKGGRGAGGNCFIKDFAAFRNMYTQLVGDDHGIAVLDSLVKKNNALLKKSNKDAELLSRVYGTDI